MDPMRVVEGRLANVDDEVGLGERVLFCKLIRDGILRHFNPNKLSDLRYVLEMRCFKGLLDDDDLKEVYFQRTWGFGEDEFLLANWRRLTVEDLRRLVEVAHTHADGRCSYPPGKAAINTLCTKEEILREYGVLMRVPTWVYRRVAAGATVLRALQHQGVDDVMRDRNAWKYVIWACEAELDASIVYTLAGRIEERELVWVIGAVESSGNPMVNLLWCIYHARPRNGLTLVLPRLFRPRLVPPAGDV